MTVVWLPWDDWAEQLEVPPGVTVDVWRSGLALPASVDQVQVYVPEYMGPAEVVEVIASLPSLDVVQTLTAGYDDVLPYLPDGVTLCNARGVHDASTAELAVGLAIASLRGIPEFVHDQAHGTWGHRYRPALADSRVIVVGAGAVGRAVADRLAPFEVEVIMVGRSEREGVVASQALPALLPTADVVVLAVPLTDDTTGMVDAAFLARLRDGALLVNVARGPVVVTEALLTEVRSGRLRAALDVTDPEPLPAGHPLWQASNVLISPHVGGHTSAFLPRARRLVSDQLVRLVSGEPLANVVVPGAVP